MVAELNTARWQALLQELVSRHSVPGASLAVLDGDRVIEAAAGVTSLRTRQPVTLETLFLLGSITKVYTATLVMKLVEDGRVRLDDPIRRHLPELRFDGPDEDEVTVARLLDHSSGVPGELFIDTGRGDDCLERYVEKVSGSRLLHRPGAMWSYCNSGFSILGRLLEKVHGKVYDHILKEALFQPLGGVTTTTFAEEAILHSVAVGHLPGPAGPEVTPQWAFPRSLGPAGGVCGTVRDLLAFGKLHLDFGTAPDGTSVIGAPAAQRMRERRQECPDPYNLAAGWGFGWALYDWDGQTLFGHDGNNIGQVSYLRCLPDRHAVIALCTNATIAEPLYRDLVGALAEELFGLQLPSRPEPSSDGVTVAGLEPLTGVYGQGEQSLAFRVEGGRLLLGPTAYTSGEDAMLRPLGEHRFLVRFPIFASDFVVLFLDPDPAGRPRYVHLAGRAWPRAQDS